MLGYVVCCSSHKMTSKNFVSELFNFTNALRIFHKKNRRQSEMKGKKHLTAISRLKRNVKNSKNYFKRDRINRKCFFFLFSKICVRF